MSSSALRIDADLPADVVEHAVGVDGAVALAEDDVAFHVDFERHVAGLRRAAEAAAGVEAPDHDAIGFDIDVAERAERVRAGHRPRDPARRRSRRR